MRAGVFNWMNVVVICLKEIFNGIIFLYVFYHNKMHLLVYSSNERYFFTKPFSLFPG